jgi:dihydropteroate synthase
MTGQVRPRRVLFLTGRLAEPALRRVVDRIVADDAAGTRIAPIVHPLGITVAGLMTIDWIGRHLDPAPFDIDEVLVPGLCEGDPAVLSEKFGVPFTKGPKDLHAIPEYFGRSIGREYGAWDIEIAAEINNAGRLSRERLFEAAEDYRSSGADIIDVGCTPGLPFPGLGNAVTGLVDRGMRVSIDSFDPNEIRTAVEAGAELVLSVNASNVAVVPDLAGSGARVVVLPELGGGLETLDPVLDAVNGHGVAYLIDPILEPVGHGFMASLERYAEVRRRYPDAEILMGIGNLTELTAADSTGVNAILIAVCQELGIRTVLTTEVIGWARGAVREIDVARRLMHYAVKQRSIPKGIDDRLVTTRDRVMLSFSRDELEALQAEITDTNFRIFADPDGITVMNSQRLIHGTDVDEIFGQLEVDEPSHAFYLGRELARASLAVALGKTYRQDGPLEWGYLTPVEERRPGRTRLTSPPARDLGD